VYEERAVTVLWNQAVHTDREVTANRPDIIIKNKKEKTCKLLRSLLSTNVLCRRLQRAKIPDAV
jgi:hypothetical protein